MLEEETITEKDLFDTKIMGILTPHPSVVRRQFWDKYNISPKAATDFYYQFSQATNSVFAVHFSSFAIRSFRSEEHTSHPLQFDLF